MVASSPLVGVETNMLLLLESGRSHSDTGTKDVQLYTMSYLDTVYIESCAGYKYNTGYSDNL